MPIIRLSISADGPVIDLGVWIGRSAAHAQIAWGHRPVPPLTISALIDTGSDLSGIHPNVLAQFRSAATGTAPIRRPGTRNAFVSVDIHDARLAFGGVRVQTRPNWIPITAAAVIPSSPNLLALIGRDLLASCQFANDGPGRTLILIY
jgi:hypothetical protein